MTTPEQRLAAGFAGRIEAWSLARQPDASIARAAGQAGAALSLSHGDGHVCIDLADLMQAGDEASGPRIARPSRDNLLASGVVGTPQARGAMPLILDAQDRLYLHRFFDDELRLARRLLQAAATPFEPGDSADRMRDHLQSLFASSTTGPSNGGGGGGSSSNSSSNSSGNSSGESDAPDWQRLAVALALRNRLTIVSGGPGTGKTTTIVNLLGCLLESDPGCRIALAAPTGKAAARMTEAIRARAGHLPEALRLRLPGDASTVHRLLGYRPFDRGFTHDATHPLAIDALVVDEASMLDLALARRLFEAVPPSARIVLLGDKDQLSAVESGAVFSELGVDPSLSDACAQTLARLSGIDRARIVAPASREASALADSVIWFTRNFRFAEDSGIGRLAAFVNTGEAEQAIGFLRTGIDGDARWIRSDSGVTDPAGASIIDPARVSVTSLDAMLAGFEPYATAIDRAPADIAAIADAFERFRVLCAVRAGSRGVDAINALLESRLRERLRHHANDGRSPWYPGRPVLVRQNDPVLRLFNGDIGIVLPDANGEPMARFPGPDGGFRAIAPVRLPAHETAFAMTVHKAQGSEFDEVLLMLPSRPNRVLSRELVYTAITRARRRVTVDASEAVLRAAIESRTGRRSGLLDRLREQSTAASHGSPSP